jgi:excisionase family DNA binding protein
MDIVAAESPLGESIPEHVNTRNGFLLSIKGAAKHLGISYSTLYELVNRGEIAHVMVGSRRYVSREQINEFITANTHTGYHQR